MKINCRTHIFLDAVHVVVLQNKERKKKWGRIKKTEREQEEGGIYRER